MTFISATAPIVVDASVAVGSVTDEQPAIDALRTWSRGSVPLLAPPVLWMEIANTLVRGQRLSPVDVSGILRTLRMCGIEIADRGVDGLDAALVLAGRHRSTVYDAAYLWLAIDVDGSLRRSIGSSLAPPPPRACASRWRAAARPAGSIRQHLRRVRRRRRLRARHPVPSAPRAPGVVRGPSAAPALDCGRCPDPWRSSAPVSSSPPWPILTVACFRRPGVRALAS